MHFDQTVKSNIRNKSSSAIRKKKQSRNIFRAV